MTEVVAFTAPFIIPGLILVMIMTLNWTLRSKRQAVSGDDPLADLLRQTLANRTGKLRVSDAYLICGIEPGKVNPDQIFRFSRAIRELGWERQRLRVGQILQYAYVRGTAAERDVELVVTYDPHLRSVSIESIESIESLERAKAIQPGNLASSAPVVKS